MQSDLDQQSEDISVSPAGICRAAAAGDLDLVNRILEADPSLIDADNPLPSPSKVAMAASKPIEIAAKAGHGDIVARLLELGSDPMSRYHFNIIRGSALAIAKQAGHDDVVSLIVNDILRRVDENRDLLTETDEHGNTLLHLAAYNSQESLIRGLLARGADPNLRNNRETQPIHLVLYEGMGGPPRLADWQSEPDIPSGKVLIEHGANYDLGCASAMGDIERVRELLAERF